MPRAPVIARPTEASWMRSSPTPAGVATAIQVWCVESACPMPRAVARRPPRKIAREVRGVRGMCLSEVPGDERQQDDERAEDARDEGDRHRRVASDQVAEGAHG